MLSCVCVCVCVCVWLCVWLCDHLLMGREQSGSRRSGTSASFNANRGSLAPCTRSKMRPPVGFTEVTGMAPAQIKMASHEEYCAAYLSFLMTRGTQALERTQVGHGVACCTALVMCLTVSRLWLCVCVCVCACVRRTGLPWTTLAFQRR